MSDVHFGLLFYWYTRHFYMEVPQGAEEMNSKQLRTTAQAGGKSDSIRELHSSSLKHSAMWPGVLRNR